jgi:hypothetical protein
VALLEERLRAAEREVGAALEHSRRAQEESAMNALSLAAEQAAEGPPSPGLPPSAAPQSQSTAEKGLDAKEERQLDAALAAPFARQKADGQGKAPAAAAAAAGAAAAKAAVPLARQATVVCSDMGTQTDAAEGPAGAVAGKASKDAKGKKGIAALSAAASSGGPLPGDAQQLVKLIPGGLLEQLRHLPKSVEGRVMARGLAAPLLWQLIDGWSERHALSVRQQLKPPTFAEHVYDAYLIKYAMHAPSP